MKKKVSIIITAFSEPDTVANLVKQIEDQVEKLIKSYDFQIILACPDLATEKAGKNQDRLGILSWVKDPGKGKPTALNLAFKKAVGEFLVLTDGDVSWSDNALALMLEPFKNANVGLVSGQPISVNKRDNVFGFWSFILTKFGADYERSKRASKNKYLDASGYLMALRSNLIDKVPENILADDAFISRAVFGQDKKIVYQPQAKVYVRYPTNLGDWLRQKKRSAGGYVQLDQIKKRAKKEKMRSFWTEAKSVFRIFKYVNSLKEFFWLMSLVIVRLYLWLIVFWERKIIKKPFDKTWVRVETTK